MTPSMEEGLDEETEYELRNMGAELIQKAGIYLKLPQVAIATAQVIFQVHLKSTVGAFFAPKNVKNRPKTVQNRVQKRPPILYLTVLIGNLFDHSGFVI